MNAPVWILAALSPRVADLVYVGLTVAFFGLAIAYAWFCEKVR